jgi:pimeloyl-ACP methyl ester carboxylesterase
MSGTGRDQARIRRMPRLFFTALLAALLFVSPAAAQSDRGRPVILLVHGRGMLDRDSAATRQLWFDGLRSGVTTLTRGATLNDGDVRVVWYADVLDPRSTEGCDYGSSDPRALRDAKTASEVKQVVSVAGGLFSLISSLAGDKESASQLRALAADASFLSDARKRCASEDRLRLALERARLEGRPVILVAHSLGSLVAYDYLSTRTDTGLVRRLVTIGSMAGAPELRRLLIGGDSTDAFSVPASVGEWVNIRNDKDPLATPLPIGRDIVTAPPADEVDPHEMVGYLRGTITAREILSAWCSAIPSNRPQGCIDILGK